MKHLLLISNIDGHSKHLLRYVSRFTKEYNLKLHILKIDKYTPPVLISSPYYYNQTGLLRNQQKFNSKKELELFIDINTKDIQDTEWASVKIMEGDYNECTEKFINDELIDLIVMRQNVIKNSITENTIFSKLFLNISRLPMLLIPENQKYSGFKKLAFFTTFSEDDFSNIMWLSKNFPLLKIHLIHFSVKPNTLKQLKWIEYLKSELCDSNISYKLHSENIETYISKEISIQKPKYDSVCLTTHRRSFWKRIIDPSTTLNLIHNIDIPVFVFKKTELV